FKNGDYFVIDSSAAAAVALSDVCGEDTVLDLCAAPGGKSFCAAILSGNKNAVTSLDLHPHRVELIKKGAHKLGLNINAFVNDARVYNQDLGCFSLVICDVPCSGLGVIKRKPEIKYKTKEEISSLPEIQLEILSTAVKYLEKDGRILYSTCTLNTDENENTVSAFLQQNKDFYLEKQQYILPSDTGGDGFFAAVIKRK
ncbi:MAG: 16S rRNA (cytosine(967)-C(5))-methyltransferase RsmB, partial [Oscillospiraceae bacterium]|nr:16S rRNA (cytosine(967)-C(5))-methyltransferase RsmB [Candidatus Equicaccousia limihippi]